MRHAHGCFRTMLLPPTCPYICLGGKDSCRFNDHNQFNGTNVTHVTPNYRHSACSLVDNKTQKIRNPLVMLPDTSDAYTPKASKKEEASRGSESFEFESEKLQIKGLHSLPNKSISLHTRVCSRNRNHNENRNRNQNQNLNADNTKGHLWE